MSGRRSAIAGTDHHRAASSTSRRALAQFAAAMLVALARRPTLIPTALRQLFVMAPHRWWTRPPHLPIPPSDYLEFRQVTATGRTEGPPEVGDTIVWLEWCRSMRAVARR